MKRPILIALLTASFAAAQAPDNSKQNQKDRTNPVTADQQKMNKSDTQLVKDIRQSVYADKTLSTYAHNVKIVVQDGHVTLRGPVRSAEEKETVQHKAAVIAGAPNVDNQLEVAPAK